MVAKNTNKWYSKNPNGNFFKTPMSGSYSDSESMETAKVRFRFDEDCLARALSLKQNDVKYVILDKNSIGEYSDSIQNPIHRMIFVNYELNVVSRDNRFGMLNVDVISKHVYLEDDMSLSLLCNKEHLLRRFHIYLEIVDGVGDRNNYVKLLQQISKMIVVKLNDKLLFPIK